MLLTLFQWLQGTPVAEAFRNSLWAFAVVQSVHLLGLAVLGGAVLIVDLRMLGVGLRSQGIAELIRYTRVWLVLSVVVLVLTGMMMFMPAAASVYYFNSSFWVKMYALPLAALFSFSVREWLVRRRPTLDTSALTRIAGLASILLWFTVTAAGRWIAYSG
jgi:uncharacterized membrane protein